MTAPLTTAQAHAVYDVLVQHAGADGTETEGVYSSRTDFIFAQTDGYVAEYRFMGALGGGGKFRRSSWDDRWYVDCYREDLTPARQAAIDATNKALAVTRQLAV